MRGYALLLILALGMAFLAGSISLQLKSADITKTNVAFNPADSLKSKMENLKPDTLLNLTPDLPTAHALELLKPESLFASFDQYSPKDLFAVNAWIDHCDFSIRNASHDLEKLKTYEMWRCKKLHDLPKDFLSQAPVMHPSGKSYAFLLKGTPNYDSRFEHFSEREMWSDSTIQEDIQSWSLDEYTALANASPLIFGASYVWYREGNEGSYSFKLFNLHTWTKLWEKESSRPVKYQPGLSCYGGASYICWSVNLNQYVWKTQKSLLWMGILSALLLLTSVAVVFMRIRNDRAQKERQRFALQMLAHELRTPIASLKLNCENMRHRFDLYTPEQQENTLRIFDDVERLRRVAERSQAYLTSTSPKRKLEFRILDIESLKSLLEDIFSPYAGQLEWKILGDDRPAKLDPYWLQVAVKNLIENALIHGRAPVFATVSLLASGINIVMQDHGNTVFNPTTRRQDSPGLGLGWGLVSAIAKESGGKLEVHHYPTRVIFEMREQ